jgi:hypothetical protein
VALGIGLAIFVAWTISWYIRERRRHLAMASSRNAVTGDQFVAELRRAGIDEDIGRFIYAEMGSYYFEPLRPDPSDRWFGTLRIDAEDLEDLTAKFWKTQGWPPPPRKNPVVVPEDPTLLEYGRWLQSQRTARS